MSNLHLSNHPAAGIRIQDLWVEHPEGRLFTRTWEPPAGAGGLEPQAPIVLLHDSLGCVELWRGFPAALCAGTGRRVVAYDRLGFGRSDPRRERPALDFVADEASTYFPALLEQLGLERFVALGHSVGGGMAVHCAADFPERCVALITESAQVFPEDRTLESIAAAKAQFQAPGQIERLAKYHGEKARWVLEAWTENWLHPGFASWTLEPVLPRVSCPVLALHGEHDEYGSHRHPRMIARLSRGESRCEILPETHHVPHREGEALIVDRVREFLTRSRS